MIPILLINLDRNPERLSMMTTQFESLGLKFSKMPAVNGKSFDDAYFNNFAENRKNVLSVGRWTKGSMGCLKSHLNAWEVAANSSSKYTAIFEDDVWIADTTKDFINTTTWIPADADIIRLESTASMKCLLSKKKQSVSDHRFLQKLLKNKSKNAFPLGTGAYIISKEAAKRALNTPQEWQLFSDRMLFDHTTSQLAKELNVYQVNPACCVQDKFYHINKNNIVHHSEIEIPNEDNIYTNNSIIKRLLIKIGKPLGVYYAFQKARLFYFHLSGLKDVPFRK